MKKRSETLRDVLRDESVAALRFALARTGDATWKRRLCAELGRRGAEEAVSDLLRALDDALSASDWRVVEAATDSLGRIGAKAAGPQLVRLLDDDNLPVGVRDSAAFALGRIGYRVAVPKLLGCLSDPQRTVRLCAVAALSAIGDSTIVARVDALLPAESDDEVREALARLRKHLRVGPSMAQEVPWMTRILRNGTTTAGQPDLPPPAPRGVPDLYGRLHHPAAPTPSSPDRIRTITNGELADVPKRPWRVATFGRPSSGPHTSQAWELQRRAIKGRT